MDLTQRIQNAIQAFRSTPARSRRSQKRAPYAFPVFTNGQAQWVMDDFTAYVREGFDMNAVIYSAVMYKAKAIAKARLKAYEGDPDNPVPVKRNHPLAQLVERPNPHQSWLEFQMQREVYLNIAGNSYTWLDRPARSALPVALYNLRPDRVRIVPETRGIKGYYYLPEGAAASQGVPMLPQDVIHVKFPNPGDPLEGMGYGLSPIAPLAQSGDVDNAITQFLKQFIDRGAMMSGLIKLKTRTDDNDVQRIKRRWREQYGGVDNWGDVGVLDVDAEYQRLGLTFKEMDFDKLDARSESRMLGPFGVPPILIFTRYGLERATYSNAEEARRALWQDTLVPELDLFQADDEYYLRSDDGAFVAYDTSTVPALQQNVVQQVDAASKLFAMGVPRNLALATVGLKITETPDGDVSYLPSTFVPAGDTTAEGEEQPLPAAANNGSDADADADSAVEDDREGGAGKGYPVRAGRARERQKRAAPMTG